MAEMTYETLELMLCGSDETILKGFARKLGFDVETAAGLTRRKLLKGICDFINETLDNGSEEENVTRLTDWLRFFGRGEDQTGEENTEVDGNRQNENMEQEPGVGNGTQDPGPQENRDFDEIGFAHGVRAEDKIHEMQQHYERLLENQRREFEALIGNIPGMDRNSAQNPRSVRNSASTWNVQNQQDAASFFRRELKIQGQIGEQGRNDQMSFVSLSRQIESAVEKGYSEKEVIEAIIKSMKPGLQLRSYIETLRDLTLPRLRQILRSHYKEKSGTQLYQELATMCQGPKESPETFLLRALDLRQKILFASQEADTNLKYDPDLVQGMFLRTIETGLRDDNILMKLRPILQNTLISDEELIHQVSSISSAETERQARLGKTAKGFQASAVVATDERENKPVSQKSSHEKTTGSHILATVQAMQAQMKTIQEQLAAQHTSTPTITHSSRPTVASGGDINSRDQNTNVSYACKSCKEKGTSAECRHCNYCQGDNHFARNCRKRQADQRQKQGNGRGLPRRDRE